MSRVLAVLLAALLTGCAGTDKKTDGPEPLPIEIDGNDNTKTRDLEYAARRELESFQSKGRRLADLADAAYAMELRLRRDGYAHATVEFEMQPSEEAPDKAIFHVAEGLQAHVAALSFPGAQHLQPDQLKRFFAGGSNPVFRQSDVDRGAGEVERAYLLDGFRDVEVGPVTVAWNEIKSEATVTVPVKEGAKYTVASVEFEGDCPGELEDELREELIGQAFYARLPVEATARLRAKLFDRGHQQATAKAQYTIEDHAVAIRIQADQGPQYRVREVRIEGAKRTRKQFIRSRLKLKKGDVLQQRKVDKALDHLYESGIFKSVAVEPAGISPEEALADLLVQVEELEARSVSFDVGWGAYELLRGGVQYRDRNFLGLGRRLDLGAHASTKGYRLEGAISDNFLLGRRNTLRVAGEIFQREEPSFTRFGYRIDLSLTHNYPGPYVFTTGYTIDTQEASDIQSGIALEEGEFITSAGLFATIVRDTRDSRLIPTKGTVAELGLFWSTDLLLADLNYVEIRGSWFGFLRLTERIVFGTGVRFTSRPILDSLPTLPIQKRLFTGGPTSVRSFDQDELGPFDPRTNKPRGGLTSAWATAEFRTRVWKQLHVALFYDVGMVSLDSLMVEGPPGQAIGAGLRYYLPVGPVRVDVGYNPGELFSMSTRWAFHFAFGFSF
ncbi:MAG: BamA/OMP85 family outer membrane protein [Planctomycetota bacterium]